MQTKESVIGRHFGIRSIVEVIFLRTIYKSFALRLTHATVKKVLQNACTEM